MPRYEVEIPHQLAPDEVRARLGRAQAKLESQYGAACAWEGDERLLVSRKGLKATVKLEADRVRVDMDLSLLLAPLAASIRSGITRELTELLGA